MKSLTDNQIDQLYQFVKNRFVEWYDVQTELVDHLANGIEDQWKNSPNLSFDQALSREFKKFGISGFYDLVEHKTKTLNKLYRRQVWFYFKSFFRLPKIILILFSIWALCQVFDFVNGKAKIMQVFVVTIFSLHLLHFITAKINIRIKKKRTRKKWLLDNTLLKLGGMTNFLNIGVWIHFLFKSDRVWTPFLEIMVSSGIVIYFLVFFISIYIIPQKLKEKISKEHPEYNFNKV